MTGRTITQVRDDIYLINVVARRGDEQRGRSRRCALCRCRCPNGRTVPLNQLATFDFEQEIPLIWRRDRVPTLTVQGDVPREGSPDAVVDALEPAIEKLGASLPAGYRIAVGGTVEDSAQIAGLGVRGPARSC